MRLIAAFAIIAFTASSAWSGEKVRQTTVYQMTSSIHVISLCNLPVRPFVRTAQR
jgi:hypothetical protein